MKFNRKLDPAAFADPNATVATPNYEKGAGLVKFGPVLAEFVGNCPHGDPECTQPGEDDDNGPHCHDACERPIIQSGGTFLASTDGKVAVFVPVVVDPSERVPQGLLPASIVQTARRSGLPSTPAEITMTPDGITAVVKLRRSKETGKTWNQELPELAKCIPTSAVVATIHVNAELLLRMQKALGAGGVTVTVHEDSVVLIVRPYKPRAADPNAFGLVNSLFPPEA